MSEPTYRIETRHDPAEFGFCQWEARAVRLSDDTTITTTWGASEGIALDAVKARLEALYLGAQPGGTYYMNEDGTLAPEPQSLRA